jgi:hypothetical protein
MDANTLKSKGLWRSLAGVWVRAKQSQFRGRCVPQAAVPVAAPMCTNKANLQRAGLRRALSGWACAQFAKQSQFAPDGQAGLLLRSSVQNKANFLGAWGEARVLWKRSYDELDTQKALAKQTQSAAPRAGRAIAGTCCTNEANFPAQAEMGAGSKAVELPLGSSVPNKANSPTGRAVTGSGCTNKPNFHPAKGRGGKQGLFLAAIPQTPYSFRSGTGYGGTL